MLTAFQNLQVRDPSVFLRQIFAEYSKLKDSTWPNLVIETEAGIRYQGKVVSLEDTGQGLLAVILSDGFQRGSSPQGITYARLYGNFSVTLMDPLDYMNLIKLGQTSRWSKDEALSALNVKRKLEEIIGALKPMGVELSYAGELIDEKSEANNVVRDILQAFFEWFTKNYQDKVGREALSVIKNIYFRDSESHLQVQLQAGNLTISFDPQQTPENAEKFFEQLDALF